MMILRTDDVARLTGLSRTTLWRLERRGPGGGMGATSRSGETPTPRPLRELGSPRDLAVGAHLARFSESAWCTGRTPRTVGEKPILSPTNCCQTSELNGIIGPRLQNGWRTWSIWYPRWYPKRST